MGSPAANLSAVGAHAPRVQGGPPQRPSDLVVFDLHQHLWPPAVVELLERRSSPPYLRDRTLTTREGSFPVDTASNDLQLRLAALDRAGIDVALVSLQPTLGTDALPPEEKDILVSAYHDGIREMVAASGGRIRALSAGVVVDGFAGVCIGASRLLDPGSLAHVLTPLQEDGGILFVHPDRVAPPPADAPAWWTAVADYTADMQAAYLAWIEHGAALWPELRVVFSLLAGGAPFQLDRLQSRDVETRRFTDAPVYLETSSYGRLSIELSLAVFGLHRIVHGSDYPVLDPERTLSVVRGLGEAAFAAIASDTPAGLLEKHPVELETDFRGRGASGPAPFELSARPNDLP